MSAPDFGPHGLAKVSGDARDLLIAELQDDRGVHLETAIFGIAAVAGTLVLRAAGLPLAGLTPGSPVFSDKINEVGPEYLAVVSAMCEAAEIDPQGGWGDPVPAAHEPLKSTSELTAILEQPFAALCRQKEVPRSNWPKVALFTAVRLLAEGREMLPTTAGKGLILSGLVAGSKTVPQPEDGIPESRTSFWKKLFK